MSTHVGEVLREARRALGISQDGLATELGVSNEFIGYIERGRAQMPAKRFAAAERFMGLPKGTLMRAACRDGRELLLPTGIGEREDSAACCVAVAWMEPESRAKAVSAVELAISVAI
jgi:transcriptional regulator with XRE-family HTH domain